MEFWMCIAVSVCSCGVVELWSCGVVVVELWIC